MLTGCTIANPTKELAYYLQSHASNTLTKSILAVGTPQYATQLETLAARFPSLQVVTAAVDTIGYGIQRNGFSWCAFDYPMEIKDKVRDLGLEKAGKWTQSTAVLRLSAGHDIAIPLANTLFSNGEQSTLIADGENIQGLHLALPLRLQVAGGYRPLVPLTEKLEITSCADNMLKTISNQAAASYLEEATKLINPETRNRTVFAQINDTQYFKVTAGGGGLWSPRTRMLVLDTSATPKIGDSIRFWLSTDLSFEAEQKERIDSAYTEFELGGGMVVEVAPVQESLKEVPLVAPRKQGFQPVFGMGSEKGYFVDDIKHEVVAETIQFK